MKRIIPLQNMLKEEQAIRQEIREHYQPEIKKSGLWSRIKIGIKIEREVRERMNQKYPPGALYIQHNTK
jgi:hypothetical protein